MIRDIAPNLYEQIYRDPEFFYRGGSIFEASFRKASFDANQAKKERASFYEKMKSSVPEDKGYVFGLLDGLFPDFAMYRDVFGVEQVSDAQAEKTKRMFHPRCFRQYFLLKVPSELFSQRKLDAFVASLRHLSQENAAEAFGSTFQSMANEDSKRWHFMHLLENRFEEFNTEVACGLCRGMAANSSLWPLDAFELMISVRCTQETLLKIVDSHERLSFLRAIVHESGSDLYTLALMRRLKDRLKPDPSHLALQEQDRAFGIISPNDSRNAKLLVELQEVDDDLKMQLRGHYLISDAPSVFEQFETVGPDRIGPNSFLLAWHQLGADAEADQRKYLRELFARRPDDLNRFLKLFFRVDFIDDYATLRPLIDYKELSQLIDLNESILDTEKVRRFRERYDREKPEGPPDIPKSSS